MKKLFLTLAKEKIHRGMREKNFSDGLKDAVVYIDKIDPKTREWHGVYVSDTRDPQNPLTITARSGRLQSRMDKMLMVLTLNNGGIHQAKGEKSTIIQFQEYSLSLPVANQQRTEAMGKSSMSLTELRKQAAVVGTDSKKGIKYLIEFHYRFILPIGALILSILGLPLALRNSPGQKPVGLPLGILFFVCFYIALTTAKSVAEENIMPVALTMWTPNIIFALLTLYILYMTEKEKMPFFIEFGIDIIQGISNRLPSLSRKKS
jgi:lipopolysaccharide export system permease protein